MEEFKICFEDYEISNLGNVRRKQKNGEYKTVKGSVLKRGAGYLYFQINRCKKRTNYLFHHLVATQFIGERPEGMVIDHIDRNSLNNNVSNLRYITQTENCRNTDRYIAEIQETERIKRKPLVDKHYRERKGEELLAKKREYYKNNAEKLKDENGKWKHKKVDVICSNCNQQRQITASSQRVSKSDWCRRCSSIKNLQKKE